MKKLYLVTFALTVIVLGYSARSQRPRWLKADQGDRNAAQESMALTTNASQPNSLLQSQFAGPNSEKMRPDEFSKDLANRTAVPKSQVDTKPLPVGRRATNEFVNSPVADGDTDWLQQPLVLDTANDPAITINNDSVSKSTSDGPAFADLPAPPLVPFDAGDLQSLPNPYERPGDHSHSSSLGTQDLGSVKRIVNEFYDGSSTRHANDAWHRGMTVPPPSTATNGSQSLAASELKSPAIEQTAATPAEVKINSTSNNGTSTPSSLLEMGEFAAVPGAGTRNSDIAAGASSANRSASDTQRAIDSLLGATLQPVDPATSDLIIQDLPLLANERSKAGPEANAQLAHSRPPAIRDLAAADNSFQPSQPSPQQTDAIIPRDPRTMMESELRSTPLNSETTAAAQQPMFESVSGAIPGDSPLWWQVQVAEPLLGLSQQDRLTVGTAIYRALENSPQIRAISQEPLIRETEIAVAEADFDPNLFAKSLYDDRVDPVGNTLTTGGLPFLQDNIWTGTAGIRRKTTSGANVSVEQKLGFQNSNSRFFTPQDQGTAVLSLNFEQPLLRNRGEFVNRSQIILAETMTNEAWEVYSAKLQDELVRVVEAYWVLYGARAIYLQRQIVYQRGLDTLRIIEGRQQLDTQAIQLAQARSAVRSREADLVNAMRDIRTAESELRRLMGEAPSTNWQEIELITAEAPILSDAPADLVDLAQVALRSRPELRRAIQQTQFAATRNQVAANQILPDLSLIFGTYVAGLEGDSNIGRAWEKQFVATTPGFSAGLSFQYPWRNRAARGRLRRSELELIQAQAAVEQATIDITADVQKAYWRLTSAVETVAAAQKSWEAAQMEYEQNVKRWESFALIEGDWLEGQTQSFVLDQLLVSQQRVLTAELLLTQAEQELKNAQVFLKRATGTLLEAYPTSSLPQTPQSPQPGSTAVEQLPAGPNDVAPGDLGQPSEAAPEELPHTPRFQTFPPAQNEPGIEVPRETTEFEPTPSSSGFTPLGLSTPQLRYRNPTTGETETRRSSSAEISPETRDDGLRPMATSPREASVRVSGNPDTSWLDRRDHNWNQLYPR